MKRGRINWNGVVHEVTPAAEANQVMLSNGQCLHESEFEWLPPLLTGTIFALGLNYADHASELAFKAPDQPLVFLKSAGSLMGHRGQTQRPADAHYMHYECELAVVIGRPARHIKRDDAYRYIAAYTIANDYAIRDYLENYYRPNLKVKNRDGCTPLGPWLVDQADIGDPMQLELTTHINGKLVQRGNTKDMVFSIPVLIEYLSSILTLSPGDIILTGTPAGLANVQVGDEVVTAIEGLGQLSNTIIGATHD